MKKIFPIILWVLVTGGLMTSCKPTEKNYQAAYDAAKAKRAAENTDPDMALMLDGHQLDRSEGGSAVKNDDGSALPVKSTSLKLDNPVEKEGDWYLAVSKYSMPTNARAQARDLRSKGKFAVVGEDADSEWYVIADISKNRIEAGEAAKIFIKKNPRFNFIGLNGTPLLLRSGSR